MMVPSTAPGRSRHVARRLGWWLDSEYVNKEDSGLIVICYMDEWGDNSSHSGFTRTRR